MSLAAAASGILFWAVRHDLDTDRRLDAKRLILDFVFPCEPSRYPLLLYNLFPFLPSFFLFYHQTHQNALGERLGSLFRLAETTRKVLMGEGPQHSISRTMRTGAKKGRLGVRCFVWIELLPLRRIQYNIRTFHPFVRHSLTTVLSNVTVSSVK